MRTISPELVLIIGSVYLRPTFPQPPPSVTVPPKTVQGGTMARGARIVFLLAGSALAGAAPPPVAAPKPPVAAIPGCKACTFLAPSRPIAKIVPVHGGPSLESTDPTPEPLPIPEDATPLPTEQKAPLDALLDRFLPDATPEERNAWAEELRHLPPELARDILAARSRTDAPLALPDSTDPPAASPLPPQFEPEPLPEPLRSARCASDSAPPTGATAAALQQAEAILLHNIANADTIAFKRSRPVFDEAPGAAGLARVTSHRVESQGELDETGDPFDLAIDGPGYFQVRRGDTVALTRRGMLRLDAAGGLVVEADGEAWLLHPPVQVPAEATAVTISQDGTVACRIADADELTSLGGIELARVLDPARLDPAGSGLYAVPESAGPVTVGVPGTAGFGTIRQGVLERSNVDLDAELKALDRLRMQITAWIRPTESQIALPADVPRR